MYRELQPGPRLTNYVECYWTQEGDRADYASRVLPDGCVDILFSSTRAGASELLVVGLMTQARTFELAAGQTFFGVRFRPAMASAFVREAVLLTDRTEPLDTLWGKIARQMIERLAEAADPLGKIRVMEGYLRPSEPPNAARKALRGIGIEPDSLSRLIQETGLSPRQFRRECSAQAGVSPKALSRILRFRRAAVRIPVIAGDGREADWARFAAECGYYDQAHFIHEFQEFAGTTPGRFLQSLRSAADYTDRHDASQT